MPTVIINNQKVKMPSARAAAAHYNRSLYDMGGSRSGGRMGQTFGGNRDLYQVLGYPKELEFEDFLAMYDRDEVGSRVVEIPPEDTWRDEPIILEGDGDEAKTNTPFTQAITAALTELDAGQELENVDVLAGIGRYSVLFVGFAGDTAVDETGATVANSLEMPVNERAKPVYLRGYDEQQAKIVEIDKEATPHYGMPKIYEITFGDKDKRKVHYSRVIHVAEKARRGRTYGIPRMKRIFNRLLDLQKVVGGGAEAYWKLVYKGIIMSLKEGALPPSDQDTIDEIEQQIEDYVNDVVRWMRVDGYEINDLGTDTVDPSNLVDTIISLISANTGIPKRLLLGAELGRIASTQDASNWAGRISARRVRYAEPVLLRPLVELLVRHGVAKMPAAGFSFGWKPLFELTELEKAQLGLAQSQALYYATGGMPFTIAGDGELRQLGGLPATPPPDEVIMGRGDGTVANVLVIRHTTKEKITPTDEPLPTLPTTILFPDDSLAEAIAQFEKDYPHLKGVLEAGLQ